MSRLSSIYRSGGLTASYPGRRIQFVKRDGFPLLDDEEILRCLHAIGYADVSDEKINKPTFQFAKKMLEDFIDIFGAVPLEAMRAKAKELTTRDLGSQEHQATDESVDEPDDTENTLSLLVLFRTAHAFLKLCGLHDLTVLDIMRPEALRFKRMLSAVMNYAKFREERLAETQTMFQQGETLVDQAKRLRETNAQYEQEIKAIEEKLQQGIVPEGLTQKATLKQINAFNYRLENELKKLQKSQQMLTLEHSRYKEQKQRLIEKLEDHHYLSLEAKREVEKLKGYLSTDPDTLREVIEDLKNVYEELQATHTTLESSLRNKLITVESMNQIEQELKLLFRILEEIDSDMRRADRVTKELNDFHENLEKQRIELSELDRQIHQVERQLVNMEEKASKLRSQASEKDKKSRETITKLQADYERLVEERKFREQELDKKKELIASLEKQMVTKRNEYQLEVRNAEVAVSQLTSHLRLYLAEMDNKIN